MLESRCEVFVLLAASLAAIGGVHTSRTIPARDFRRMGARGALLSVSLEPKATAEGESFVFASSRIRYGGAS
jgi:hypothetical protein